MIVQDAGRLLHTLQQLLEIEATHLPSALV